MSIAYPLNVWEKYPDVWETYHLPLIMCGELTIYLWEVYPDVWRKYRNVCDGYPDVWRMYPNLWQTYHFDVPVSLNSTYVLPLPVANSPFLFFCNRNVKYYLSAIYMCLLNFSPVVNLPVFNYNKYIKY
jgi:hypothetical protein